MAYEKVFEKLQSQLSSKMNIGKDKMELHHLDYFLEQFLQQKEKEIHELRSTAASSVAATPSTVPFPTLVHPSGTPMKSNYGIMNNNNSNGNNNINPFGTPQAAPMAHEMMISPIPHMGTTTAKKAVSTTATGGAGEKWNMETSSIMKNVSPAAKEAARLNSELLKEVNLSFLPFRSFTVVNVFFSFHKQRKKFYQLQEQHSELLSLLAQQEVEINVFKQKMEEKLGEETMTTIESEAQQNVVKLYGSYTNYRKYQDDFY
jgi:hypothetical protein